MGRVYNFSPGPAMLPEAVLEQVRDELLDYHGSGMSVMEVSHRGKDFMTVAEEAEKDLRDLLSINGDYHVLFLQGGATSQFSMVPQNILRGRQQADYLVTGNWGKKAVKAARVHCDVKIAASSEEDNFTHIPDRGDWRLSSQAAYVHYTPNETIQGVEFHEVPEVGDVPLVADMSSTILSRPIDVHRFGVIYAGAQKNIGPAGLTLVIIRKDLIAEPEPGTPMMSDYRNQIEAGSMFNTPPTFAWYVCGLVFKWLKAQGGLKAMGETNHRKASKLYEFIDESDFYSNPVKVSDRSWMNVPFILADDQLNADFLAGADQAGLTNLKGHRSVGGMRASIYNAMPEAGVDALIEYMRDFAKRRA